MENEFSGIEKRLDELVARLARLRPLGTESREAFEEDPYLDDLEEYATRIRVWLHEKGQTDA
jgi:hypothetical protein